MKQILVAFAFLLLSSITGATLAQEEALLRLRLNRDFGVGIGSRIQGTFTLEVDGPDDLVRVVFMIDEQSIGEDVDAPFRLQFRTNSFQPGAHRLSAVGYSAAGNELHSNQISRVFLSSGDSSRITTILVVILVALIAGGRLLAWWIADRGQGKGGRRAITGPLGGTICPNCGRAYALHLWGINLVAGRLDRCPHCGKWRFVRRVSTEALQAASEASEADMQAKSTTALSDEERLRRQLDDSRFDEIS